MSDKEMFRCGLPCLINQIRFESLTNETLGGALHVIRRCFFMLEPVSFAVKILYERGASDELIELCLNAAKDGVSVVAYDIVNVRVVGVLFNKIQVPTKSGEKSYFQQFSDTCRYKSSKSLVDFMINMDSRINLFEHYGVDCILELMFLAVLPEYGKRRIGEQLVLSSLGLGSRLKRGENVRKLVIIRCNDKITNETAIPSVTSAIMTSVYSQRIAEKLGFDRLLDVSYDEFEFKGIKYSERIGEVHSRCSLVARKL